jgi:hypothetical protein
VRKLIIIALCVFATDVSAIKIVLASGHVLHLTNDLSVVTQISQPDFGLKQHEQLRQGTLDRKNGRLYFSVSTQFLTRRIIVIRTKSLKLETVLPGLVDVNYPNFDHFTSMAELNSDSDAIALTGQKPDSLDKRRTDFHDVSTGDVFMEIRKRSNPRLPGTRVGKEEVGVMSCNTKTGDLLNTFPSTTISLKGIVAYDRQLNSSTYLVDCWQSGLAFGVRDKNDFYDFSTFDPTTKLTKFIGTIKINPSFFRALDFGAEFAVYGGSHLNRGVIGVASLSDTNPKFKLIDVDQARLSDVGLVNGKLYISNNLEGRFSAYKISRAFYVLDVGDDPKVTRVDLVSDLALFLNRDDRYADSPSKDAQLMSNHPTLNKISTDLRKQLLQIKRFAVIYALED